MKKKRPYLDNEIVCFMNSEEEYKEGVYLPVASFITSYARRKTVMSAQKITDDYINGISDLEFIYADTDSLHVKFFLACIHISRLRHQLPAYDLHLIYHLKLF